MDTITYTKQTDGTFIKVATHVETSTELDNVIATAADNVQKITADIAELEIKLKFTQNSLLEAHSNLDNLTATNVGKDTTEKTFSEKTLVKDVANEVLALQATIDNLTAGLSKDPIVQAKIDAYRLNLQDGLTVLMAN